MQNIEDILLQGSKPEFVKPAKGPLTYILHQDEDTSWRVVCLKAELPKDKQSIRAILESALKSLGE